MQTVRQVLRDHLEKINPDKDWSFITSQIGMFSFTGLTPPQVSYSLTLPHVLGLTVAKPTIPLLDWFQTLYIARVLPTSLTTSC